jgi:hypothetical protein
MNLTQPRGAITYFGFTPQIEDAKHWDAKLASQKAHGYNCVVVSYFPHEGGHGPDLMPGFVQACERAQMPFLLLYDGLHYPGNQDKDLILHDWIDLYKQYAGHPLYVHFQNRPMMLVWASMAVPDATWQYVHTGLSAKGIDWFLVAEGLYPENFDSPLFSSAWSYMLHNTKPNATLSDILSAFDLAQKWATGFRNVRNEKTRQVEFKKVALPRPWFGTAEGYYNLQGDKEWGDRSSGHYLENTGLYALLKGASGRFDTTWDEGSSQNLVPGRENSGMFENPSHLLAVQRVNTVWAGQDK